MPCIRSNSTIIHTITGIEGQKDDISSHGKNNLQINNNIN